jgi:hypothetical protein
MRQVVSTAMGSWILDITERSVSPSDGLGDQADR